MTVAQDNPSAAVRPQDLVLAKALLGGDEAAFSSLVRQHHAGFVRLALSFVHDQAIADELVQETWLVAIEKLPEFAGRSSLKTWLCGILINLARNRRRKEGRTLFESPVDEAHEPAVPADRFSPPGHRWDGHWQAPPSAWPGTPERTVLSSEMRKLIEAAIAVLPENQRAVLVLHDVEGLPGEEVASVLGLSEGNQRVLLHRARSRVRGLLETHYLSGGGRPS